MNNILKRRISRKEESPANDRSVNSLKKLITSEEENIPSRYSHAQKFIPFICERDSIGRLITVDSLPKLRSHKSTKKIKANPKILSKNHSKNRLVKKDAKSEIPPVGCYNLSESWIKKSFSHKLSPDLTPASALIPSEKTSEKLIMCKLPTVIKRTKKTGSVLPRKKGIWEDLPLQSVPDKYLKEDGLNSDLKGVLNCHLNISKTLDKLKYVY